MTYLSSLIVLVSITTIGPAPPVASAGSWPALRPPDGGIGVLTLLQEPGCSGVGVEPGLCAGVGSPANRGGPVNRAGRR